MKLWFERGAWVSQNGRKVISMMAPEDVKRVAVIRHAALGDMILVRPFLIETRKFFPNAEIVLSLVSNYTYGAPLDLVDSVHTVHGKNERQVSWQTKLAKFRELGASDILFDLANTTRSRYVCALNKARLKVGFPYRLLERSLLLDAAVFRSDFIFEAESMLHMLMLFGANPRYPLNFAWPHHLLDPTRPKLYQVIYFPFASVQTKCWPDRNFYSLVDNAAIEHPEYTHILLPGMDNHENLDYYVPLSKKHKNVVLQSRLNLEKTIGLLASSCLVVSNDTGIRNLAISLDTATLGIFFSTVPYRYWPRDGRHYVIFRENGEVPSTEDVFQVFSKLLRTKNYDEIGRISETRTELV
jgi:ADP-heptose:LPS heptosyltransferase